MAEVFHGGRLDEAIAQFGGKREDWLDLSTGINPNPYPIPDISPEAWARLPGRDAEEALLNAARDYYQVPDHMEIVAAPGTQSTIQLLPRVLELEEVSIVSPTYAEHAHVWRGVGAQVTKIAELDEANGFAQVAVVVNPNNPDARERPLSELHRISEQIECLVVDEAFADAVPELSLVPEMPRNSIVLKSFGKFFGLAGLRLGFAICNPAQADKLRSHLGPWAVSGAALEIGTHALSDAKWCAETKKSLFETSSVLATTLEHFGQAIEGINPLFVYVKQENNEALCRYLATKQILVRPFPDRPEHLRFGIPANDKEMGRLTKALGAFTHA